MFLEVMSTVTRDDHVCISLCNEVQMPSRSWDRLLKKNWLQFCIKGS